MKKTIQLSLISVTLLSSLEAEKIVNLDTITVSSATKSEQSIKDVTSNINVITSDEIEEKHYTTVAEALSSVAGINFSSNGGVGAATSVFVRGFDSKRVLVLIDGVRYNDLTGLNGAPFEHLMVSDIAQIEIIKGAQSGIWGADASAGVINIITKSAKKGAHASANVEYGSFNTKKFGASASYKADNYYAKISSQKITTDGFSAQVPSGEDVEDFERDGYTNTTTNIKAGLNITDTNKVDILHTIIHAQSAYDTPVYDTSWNLDPVASANTKDTTQTNDTFSKINFNHVDSFNTVDIYASRSLFDRNYPQSPYTQEFDGEVLEYGIKSNIPYREKDFLVMSLDYKTFAHKNELNEKYSNKGVSLTNSNFLGNILDGDIVVTESLRRDFYDKFDDKTTGKFGVKYLSGSIESLIFSANVGTAYNVPTLYNLYSAYGSENINPENTKSFDISAEYKKVQITYFKNFIEDMIDFDMSTYKYNNIEGTSTIQGVELAYKNSLTEALMINTNYTYLDAKDKDGKILARRPKDTANLGFDYYMSSALSLGIYGQYIGERYDALDRQGAQTGKYALANLVANYEIDKNFTTYAKVDNILDREYQVADGYATAGRSFYLGLNLSY
jgi:vitamin B12 transporter